jgi:hypothetical protein
MWRRAFWICAAALSLGVAQCMAATCDTAGADSSVVLVAKAIAVVEGMTTKSGAPGSSHEPVLHTGSMAALLVRKVIASPDGYPIARGDAIRMYVLTGARWAEAEGDSVTGGAINQTINVPGFPGWGETSAYRAVISNNRLWFCARLAEVDYLEQGNN